MFLNAGTKKKVVHVVRYSTLFRDYARQRSRTHDDIHKCVFDINVNQTRFGTGFYTTGDDDAL
jgi:hypothetical protein